MNSMPSTSSPLSIPGYTMALTLIVFPTLDFLAGVWPLQPRTLSWRVGAFGLLAQPMVMVLLGFFVAVVIAHLLRQRRMLLVLSVVCTTMALGLVIGAVLFGLDAVQLRASMTAAGQSTFERVTLVAFIKSLGICVALVIFALVSYRSAKAYTAHASAMQPSPTILRTDARTT